MIIKPPMLDATQNRFDPMQRIHEDLHELVMQHISISCSEVSKNWSLNSTKSIQLNLSKYLAADDLDIILSW